MRTVTVGGPRLFGASVKGCAAALLLGIAALQGSLPVLLIAAPPPPCSWRSSSPSACC